MVLRQYACHDLEQYCLRQVHQSPTLRPSVQCRRWTRRLCKPLSRVNSRNTGTYRHPHRDSHNILHLRFFRDNYICQKGDESYRLHLKEGEVQCERQQDRGTCNRKHCSSRGTCRCCSASYGRFASYS